MGVLKDLFSTPSAPPPPPPPPNPPTIASTASSGGAAAQAAAAAAGQGFASTISGSSQGSAKPNTAKMLLGDA